MQFKERYTFQRIDQDLAPDKRTTSTHLNIENMEIFLTSRGASLQVAKGQEAFDDPSSLLASSHVIGHGSIDNDTYIFITNNKSIPDISSSDAILKVLYTDTLIELELVKSGNWYFSTLNPIDCIGIIESSYSEKLYWIDGFNQARYLNVGTSADSTDSIDYVLSNLNPAVITAVAYGLSAGREAVVRYAYTQYNIGGSESKLSPLTNPINISSQGNSASIAIVGLSTIYDNYRIYRVMWETYKGEPTYAIVDEGIVPADSSTVNFIDGGDTLVTSISLDEFVDIGSDLLVPSTIIAKKNRLFFGNYTVEPFETKADIRAFGFDNTATSLDTASAIPDEFIDFTVTKDGYTTKATLIPEIINPTTESDTLCSINCDDKYLYFSPPGDVIYLSMPSTAAFSVYVDIYDSLNPNVPLNSSRLYMDSEVYSPTTNVLKINLHPISGSYTFKVWSSTLGGTPQLVKIDWGTSVAQELIFNVYHDQVPDIDGWSYTGITALLNTTKVKITPVVHLPGEVYYSAYYTPVSAVVDGGATKTTLTYQIIPSAVVNGITLLNGTVVAMSLSAKFSGTRQAILNGAIGLYNTGYTPGVTVPDPYSTYTAVPKEHDAINPDYDAYKYQSDGTTVGAEGSIIKLELTSFAVDESSTKNRIFKSGEVYRIGAVFYDQYGRSTPAYWVADMKIPYADGGSATTGYKNAYKLEGSVKDFPTGTNGEDAISVKFVYVQRTLEHRTILAQGVVQPVMDFAIAGENIGLYPFPNMKEVKGNQASAVTTDFGHFDTRTGGNPNTSEDFPTQAYSTYSSMDIHDRRINLVYTPETFLYKTDLPANNIRLVGIQDVMPGQDKTRLEFYDSGDDQGEQETFDSIVFDIKTNLGITYSPTCMFDSFGTDDTDSPYSIHMFYRGGGRFRTCTEKDESLDYCKYLGIDSVTTIDSYVISNLIDQAKFAGLVSEIQCNYEGEFPDCYVIAANSTTWAGTNQYQDFLDGVVGFGTILSDRAFPIVELIQNVTSQYGGDSFEAKSMNIYIDSSEATTTLNAKVTLFGDMYSGVYYLPRATSSRILAEAWTASVFDYVKVSLESEVSMDVANKLLSDINGNLDGAISGNLKVLEVKNLLTYDTIFSHVPNALTTLSVPFNYVQVTDYDNRITVSNSKHAGEVVDNWTKINLGTYMDLESQYGAITKLVRAGDRVFSFQARAIAFISIFPEKQIQTTTGGLQLAKGSVLDNFIYITVNSGTENKQAIAVYGEDVFFIDTVNKTLNTLREGEVSPIKGFNSVVNASMTDGVSQYLINNPDGGFVVVNNGLKQVLFKFSSDFPMLAYNYITKQFTNTRTYDNTYFFNHNKYVLSSKDSVLYIHDKGAIGNYAGETKPARIHMYIEPLPGVDKVFDAVEVLKAGDSIFDKVTVISPTRTSGKVPITFSSKYDIHNAFLPRVENSIDRFRERNVEIILEYNGTDELDVDEIFVKFSAKK